MNFSDIADRMADIATYYNHDTGYFVENSIGYSFFAGNIEYGISRGNELKMDVPLIRSIFKDAENGRVKIDVPEKTRKEINDTMIKEAAEVGALRVANAVSGDLYTALVAKGGYIKRLKNRADMTSFIKESLVSGYLTESFEVVVEDTEIKPFRKGMKFLKGVNHFIRSNDLPDLSNRSQRLIDSYFTDLSMEKQKETILNSDIYISINPLDFLVMSFNKNNWSSCVDIKDGAHASGSYGHSLTKTSVIMYANSPTNELLNDNDIPNMIWRVIIYIDNNQTLTSKQYPFHSVSMASFIKDYLREEIEKIVDKKDIKERTDMRLISLNEAIYNDSASPSYSGFVFGDYEYLDKENSIYEYSYYICPSGKEETEFMDLDHTRGLFSIENIEFPFYCDSCGDGIIETDYFTRNYQRDGEAIVDDGLGIPDGVDPLVVEFYCDLCS